MLIVFRLIGLCGFLGFLIITASHLQAEDVAHTPEPSSLTGQNAAAIEVPVEEEIAVSSAIPDDPEPAYTKRTQTQQVALPTNALAYSDHSLTKASRPIISSPETVQTTPSHARTSQCPNENYLQKSVAVLAFPRLKLNSSNAGDLYQAEQQLPLLLSQALVLKRGTLAPLLLGEALPMSDASSEMQVSVQAQNLASRHNSQLILSGEILDMSMTDPDSIYKPALYSRAINGTLDLISTKNRWDKRERLFSFQVHLRDGFTGQPLFTKRYDTYGVWPHAESVGFANPLFWKSDYARQIKSLVNTASNDLMDVIRCQPFIAQIESRPGQTQIILQGGTNHGLHAGDTLALYQLVVQASETRYQEHQVRLVNRNANIQLQEVYPSHSLGVIDSSTYFAGKMLAVSP
jgi:hypothetical protein